MLRFWKECYIYFKNEDTWKKMKQTFLQYFLYFRTIFGPAILYIYVYLKVG